MAKGARTFDVSEDLFKGEDDDPKQPFPKESPSKAFLAMTKQVGEKVERRKRKPRTIAASVFDRSRHEVAEMIRSGEWEGVRASHLVALYDIQHLECYGVACLELGPSERHNAMMMAATLTKKHFGGDYAAAMEFMRWAWTKEKLDEKWRREAGRLTARRIGTRLMFGGQLVTDYRVALARAGKTT